MSVSMTLPTALGDATVQFSPNTDINPGWKDRPELVDVYMELKQPFAVNRINFESANIRFEVHADGSRVRQSNGLTTYTPGGFGSTVTSDKSRAKIVEAFTSALEAFVASPAFAQTVKDAEHHARQALAAKAMDPQESLAQVNKKYEDIIRYIR